MRLPKYFIKSQVPGSEIKFIALEKQVSIVFSHVLRLHYVPGGHGGHVSDNREQNGITVRQRRETG